MSLLKNEDARVLMYIWGGDHAPGVILESPYLDDRGRIVIVRGAGTGAAIEDVDLARDHREAFGSEPDRLVGIAVSVGAVSLWGEMTSGRYQMSALKPKFATIEFSP